MKVLGNILWFIVSGLILGLMWFLGGVIWCITIIGIPFGLQCFKISKLMFWPMGRVVKTNFDKHPVANVIWIIFGGLEFAIAYFLAGVLWCITIIGIPFGRQCFKLAKLGILPFGAEVGLPEATA